MTGELHRDHWSVPVHGLAPADLDGTAQAMARPDGTVILRLTFGESHTAGQLDVCRAAQLSTSIWEAAGIAQDFISCVNSDRLLPRVPSIPASEHLAPDWCQQSEQNESPDSPPRRSRPRRLTPAGDGTDTSRTIGLHIRRIREDRDKSLRVISGLAGMSSSTLHRIEHGRRELTVSEIVALAQALEITPGQLISSLCSPWQPVPHRRGDWNRPS